MFQKLKMGYARIGAAVSGIFLTGVASAAEPSAAVVAAFEGMQDEAMGVIATALPIVAAILAAMFGIRIIKRVSKML